MSKRHDADAAHYGFGKKALESYIIGFVLSLVLTLAAFATVYEWVFNVKGLYITLAGLAITQFFVQIMFFLRINARTEDDRWNLVAFIFTLLIIAIVITGSLWIMYNLNYYMVH